MRLTDRQVDLQIRARRFARERVLPVANRLDPERSEIPAELLSGLSAEGWFGITIPAELGGLGLGVVEYCVVSEELACAWMSVAGVIGYTNGSVAVIDAEAHPDLVRRMAAGEFIPAFSLTEPEAGSDAAGIVCAADRAGDGWRITGRKRWCGFALDADAIIVYARTAPPTPDSRSSGISAFLVAKERGSFPPGLTGQPIPKIGYFGITSWQLDFDRLELPAGALLHVEGEAFAVGMRELTTARVQTAARSIGCARAALEDAVAYASCRQQFGRRIGEFQAIRFRLAEMATQVAAARSLMYAAAERLDAGQEAETEAAMAKLFASEMAEWVTSEALQIHGGNGYTTEHAVERHWRDARLTRIIEGTSEIQKHIVSRALLQGERP
jgi:alkylation response protein AidB-like acyl-CoA dehydrogenase